MQTKEIYEKYIEEFTDEVKDYVKGTKGTDGNKYHDWQTMLEIAEQFRVDMLAVIQSQDVKLGENQAPKIVEKGMQSKHLGDVSGCPDILKDLKLLLHKGKRSQIHEFEIRDIINKYGEENGKH